MACWEPKIPAERVLFMKDFGLINLTESGEPFPVYFEVSKFGRLNLSYSHQSLMSVSGKVMVRYDGVYAGTTADLDNFIFRQVERYLIDNKYVIITGENMGGEKLYGMASEKSKC